MFDIRDYTLSKEEIAKAQGALSLHNSKVHHYIPIYLLKGFLNESKRFFVYNKKHNLLDKIGKVPSSICFEYNRNTVTYDGIKTDYIEEVVFRKIDNKFGKLIDEFQKKKLSEIDFHPQKQEDLFHFVVNLYWRIPHIDDEVKRIFFTMQKLNPFPINQDFENTIKVFRQMNFFHIMEKMNEMGGLPGFNTINSLEKDSFLITDNPIVIKEIPNSIEQFMTMEYMLPLSSTKIYSRNNQKPIESKEIDIDSYNLKAFNQATEYIACADFELLKRYVDDYRLENSLN